MNHNKINKYRVVGLMSGTSLDGIDMAFAEFEFGIKLSFNYLAGKTVRYDRKWRKKLSELENSTALELTQADSELGVLFGNEIKSFLPELPFPPDFISSHGHTVFHQPEKGFTLQIGSAPAIAAITGLPVVCDFRRKDVYLGGQGAPLVPIGDRLLFSEYDLCLNLGGIANISFDLNDRKRIAFDICPANMALNYLANKLDFEFDENGNLGRAGNIDDQLLEKLNSLAFYSRQPPKSLGKEWFLSEFIPIIENSGIPLPNMFRTAYEHMAVMISRAIPEGARNRKMIITGGGAHNSFLIERLKAQSNIEIEIPSKEIIDFKEAIVFGFLGVLRWREENNCLKDVTGAIRDNCGGAIYI